MIDHFLTVLLWLLKTESINVEFKL
jgi:hypothetical protein